MALKGEDGPTGGCVPDLYRLIIAPRGQALAVMTEAHAEEATGVPLESQQLVPVGSVPNPHCLVLAHPNDALPVCAGGHAPDHTRVPLFRDDILPSSRLP